MSLIVNEARSCGLFNASIREAVIHKAKAMMWMFARRADYYSYCEAKEFLAELGVKRLDGTLAHRVGCSLLGLRRKEQLSLKVARIKKLSSKWKVFP
jgi:hypothetical protein